MTKEQQIEEFLKRVRLTPEAIGGLRPKLIECGICNTQTEVCKLTELDKAHCWARRASEAQLNKVLNDPDLALIDRGEKLPALNEEYYARRGASLMPTNYLPVIPLAEALNEVPSGISVDSARAMKRAEELRGR